MTFSAFIASKQPVPSLREALWPRGYDYGEAHDVPAILYAEDIVVWGEPGGHRRTAWCRETFDGTLAQCEAWLYLQLMSEMV